MPYPCRMVESLRDERKEPLRVGDMFYAPWQLEPEWSDALAPNYVRDWLGKRSPLIVMLPDGSLFSVDTRAHGRIYPDREHAEQFGYYGDGWTVTGVPPLITVSPSINMVGSYHGFLQGGVLTDDIDGRAAAHAKRWQGR